MKEDKKSNSNHDLQDHIEAEHTHEPKWKRVHHTWWFWIFLVLMLAGILYYVMTVDFAFAPHKQMEQKMENNSTP